MHFAKEMMDAKVELEKQLFECFIPKITEACLENPELNMDLDFCIENDCQMDHFRKIENSDAVLVVNHGKNGIDGYIGGAVLTEMAIAKYLGKKIFILNELPSEEELRHVLEVKLTQPIILNGDLKKIKNYV